MVTGEVEYDIEALYPRVSLSERNQAYLTAKLNKLLNCSSEDSVILIGYTIGRIRTTTKNMYTLSIDLFNVIRESIYYLKSRGVTVNLNSDNPKEWIS